MENELKNSFIIEQDFDQKEEFLIRLILEINCLNQLRCFLCKRDISKSMKFICEQCDCQAFCINCLITKRHPADHDFHTVDKLDFPLFTENWKIIEEYKLLHNLAVLGLNNWEGIKNVIKNKGEVECESHYYSFYYTEKGHILEENSVILDARKNIIKEQFYICEEIQKKKLQDYYTNYGSFPLLPKNIKEKKNGLLFPAELLEFNKKINEFDKEFSNDKEILLGFLEFDVMMKKKI